MRKIFGYKMLGTLLQSLANSCFKADEQQRNDFDKETADERIKRMYCITKSNAVLHAPFVSDRACAELYETYKSQIKDYNVYDFMVALNDVIANHYNLLRGWWKNEEWSVLLIKFSEIAVNWLNDDDTPYRGEKAWCVLGA